jgi:hypothetical protein
MRTDACAKTPLASPRHRRADRQPSWSTSCRQREPAPADRTRRYHSWRKKTSAPKTCCARSTKPTATCWSSPTGSDRNHRADQQEQPAGGPARRRKPLAKPRSAALAQPAPRHRPGLTPPCRTCTPWWPASATARARVGALLRDTSFAYELNQTVRKLQAVEDQADLLAQDMDAPGKRSGWRCNRICKTTSARDPVRPIY